MYGLWSSRRLSGYLLVEQFCGIFSRTLPLEMRRWLSLPSPLFPRNNLIQYVSMKAGVFLFLQCNSGVSDRTWFVCWFDFPLVLSVHDTVHCLCFSTFSIIYSTFIPPPSINWWVHTCKTTRRHRLGFASFRNIYRT